MKCCSSSCTRCRNCGFGSCCTNCTVSSNACVAISSLLLSDAGARRARAGTVAGVWDVLSSMTPSDYSSFRNILGRSSDFSHCNTACSNSRSATSTPKCSRFIGETKRTTRRCIARSRRRAFMTSAAPAVATRLRRSSRSAVARFHAALRALQAGDGRLAGGLPQTPPRTGICTSLPSGWWTWIIASSSGASSI